MKTKYIEQEVYKSIEQEVYKSIDYLLETHSKSFDKATREELMDKIKVFINDCFSTPSLNVTFLAFLGGLEEDSKVKYYDLAFFAFAKNKIKMLDAITELADITPLKLDYYTREFSRIYFLVGVKGRVFRRGNKLFVPISLRVKSPRTLILSYLLNYYLTRAVRFIDTVMNNRLEKKVRSFNLWQRIKMTLKNGPQHIRGLSSIIYTLYYRADILAERSFDRCIVITAKLLVEVSSLLFRKLKVLLEKLFIDNLKHRIINYLKETFGWRRLGTFIRELYATIQEAEERIAKEEVKWLLNQI